MLDAFFLTVNSWMAGAGPLVGLGCFVWGAVSVLFSPCHMAAIPLIIAYVGGQQKILAPRVAGGYAAAFTAGLFITILIIGIACALLGRMLGDVGSYWQIPIGLILVWAALGMLGVQQCTLSGRLQRFNLKGLPGAFLLGAGLRPPVRLLHLRVYRPRSWPSLPCREKSLSGRCLSFCSPPVIVCRSWPPAVPRPESGAWRKIPVGSTPAPFFRKGAGFVIGLLGLYFILTPFYSA